MFTLLRRIAGSICIVFAVIAFVAILDQMTFTAVDLLASFIVFLLMVVLPMRIGLRLLGGSSEKKEEAPPAPQAIRPLAAPPPPPPSPPPVEDDDRDELEVDILQLARKKGGRLTVLEAVTELEVGVDEAQAVLEDLQVRGIAGVLVSDSGLLVYSFHELQHLDDKDEAKPVGLSFRKS